MTENFRRGTNAGRHPWFKTGDLGMDPLPADCKVTTVDLDNPPINRPEPADPVELARLEMGAWRNEALKSREYIRAMKEEFTAINNWFARYARWRDKELAKREARDAAIDAVIDAFHDIGYTSIDGVDVPVLAALENAIDTLAEVR